jgi:hypothetical protein
VELDLHIVADYVRRAATEELLDRVTVYRDGMEPAAVDLMENELARRGFRPEEIAAHDQRRRESVLFHDDGTAVRCSYCERPAVARVRGWHRIGGADPRAATDSLIANGVLFVGRRLLGWLPLFPRTFYYCEEHRPTGRTQPPGY